MIKHCGSVTIEEIVFVILKYKFIERDFKGIYQFSDFIA